MVGLSSWGGPLRPAWCLRQPASIAPLDSLSLDTKPHNLANFGPTLGKFRPNSASNGPHWCVGPRKPQAKTGSPHPADPEQHRFHRGLPTTTETMLSGRPLPSARPLFLPPARTVASSTRVRHTDLRSGNRTEQNWPAIDHICVPISAECGPSSTEIGSNSAEPRTHLAHIRPASIASLSSLPSALNNIIWQISAQFGPHWTTFVCLSISAEGGPSSAKFGA